MQAFEKVHEVCSCGGSNCQDGSALPSIYGIRRAAVSNLLRLAGGRRRQSQRARGRHGTFERHAGMRQERKYLDGVEFERCGFRREPCQLPGRGVG